MISASIDRTTRKAVYSRDHYRCALCDSTYHIQIHHAIPRGQGGSNDERNLITLCQRCHMLVHGQADRCDDYWASPAEIAQECVTYLADLYAPNWWPWRSGYHPGTWNGGG